MNGTPEQRLTGLERLWTLADHLVNGKLGHECFDFSEYAQVTDCGTAGCALGECPSVWPHSWAFRKPSLDYGFMKGKSFPVLHRQRPHAPTYGWSGCDPLLAAAKWFALDEEEREPEHLFVPDSQQQWLPGMDLPEGATKEQVAANILTFIQHQLSHDPVLAEVL